MFNDFIVNSLKDLTYRQPENESEWYGAWNAILSELFPSKKGYIISPQTIVKSISNDYIIPDFYIEVLKITSSTIKRIVLIVEIKNTPRWPGWKEKIEEQITQQSDYAFDKTAKEKVYCIMAIGPHWKYGIKHDDGQKVESMIDWHETIHDIDSYNDFKKLKKLVKNIDN